MEAYFAFRIHYICIVVNALCFHTGFTASNGRAADCGAKTTRSSMSRDSIYFQRTINMLGNATCCKLRKPWVCS